MKFSEHLKTCLLNETWLPFDYINFAPYAALSSIVQRKIYTKYSRRHFFPNFYFVFIGDSGAGKELLIHDTIEKMISSVNTELLGEKIFTPEALLDSMSHSPCLTVCNDEMVTIFSKRKYMADMAPMLTELYNSSLEVVSRKLVSKKYIVRKPYLSLILGTQPQTFIQLFDAELLPLGLIQRLFLVPSPKRKRIVVKSDDENYDEALNLLRSFNRAVVMRKSPIYVPISPSAVKKTFAFIEELADDVLPFDASLYYNRFVDHIFKLALLILIDDVLLSKSPPFPGYPVSFGPLEETCISSNHVEFAIDLMRPFHSERERFVSICVSPQDYKIKMRLISVIERLLAKGKFVNNDASIYVKNRDILNSMGFTQKRLHPYLLWLQADGVISPQTRLGSRVCYEVLSFDFFPDVEKLILDSLGEK